ncbi:MAG: DMT family transporter [Acidimicrobiales bacterium]|jgi:drug/metabolite transporter (DMT)-like permease
MTRRGWALFIALGIIWGLPYLLIKVAVREISPSFLVLLRTGGGALVLLPIAAIRGEVRAVLKYWRPLALYTAVEMGGPWILLFHAEERLPSSLSGLLVAAVPLAGAVLAWLTRSDRLDPRRLLGLVVGFGGVALLVGFDVGHADLWAAASIGGVVVGYALGPWIVAHHLSEAPPLGLVAGSLVLCALVYIPIAAFQLPHHALRAPEIESVVALTLVCTVLAFVIFFALIGEVGAYRATIITYVNPAVAVLLGVTVLGEPFGLATVAGFVLIIIGCFFATGRSSRQRSQEQRESIARETALPTVNTD